MGATVGSAVGRDTVPLDVACKRLGIGKTLGFELARRGEFPVRVIALGRVKVVPTAELDRLLGLAPDPEAAGEARPVPNRALRAEEV